MGMAKTWCPMCGGFNPPADAAIVMCDGCKGETVKPDLEKRIDDLEKQVEILTGRISHIAMATRCGV